MFEPPGDGTDGSVRDAPPQRWDPRVDEVENHRVGLRSQPHWPAQAAGAPERSHFERDRLARWQASHVLDPGPTGASG